MKIYLTGATGAIGSEILKIIPTAIPLVRKPSGLKKEIITHFTLEELAHILHDADVVLHFAGSLDFEDHKKLRETNVELTRRIVKATPEKARIIYAGSIAVYGKKETLEAVHEKTQIHPDTMYAKTKLEGENLILHHPHAISLRIAAVYSPRIKIFEKMLKLIKKERLPILGHGNNRLAFVSAKDVALAVKSALKAKRGIYVICGEALSQKKIYELVAKILHVRPPHFHVSVGLARVIGLLGLFPKEYVSFLASDRVFDYSKAKKELKYKPQSLEQGIKDMVKELKL